MCISCPLPYIVVCFSFSLPSELFYSDKLCRRYEINNINLYWWYFGRFQQWRTFFLFSLKSYCKVSKFNIKFHCLYLQPHLSCAYIHQCTISVVDTIEALFDQWQCGKRKSKNFQLEVDICVYLICSSYCTIGCGLRAYKKSNISLESSVYIAWVKNKSINETRVCLKFSK